MKEIDKYKLYLDVLYYKIINNKTFYNNYKNELDEYINNIYPYLNYIYIDSKINKDNKLKNLNIIKNIYNKYKID
jgi:hypothetical protein